MWVGGQVLRELSCWSAAATSRVARFFLAQTYPIGKNIPNDRILGILNGNKFYQMDVKYFKWS
jgi:hypothetical protein